MPLVVVDDGSSSPEKEAELKGIGGMAEVRRIPHGGFCRSWVSIFEWLKEEKRADAYVLLEDDLVFAHGWLDVLMKMHRGLLDAGFVPGAMTCLRYHPEPQGQVFTFGDVQAYQSMYHGFQVNLVPREFVERTDLVLQAAGDVAPGRHGFDVNWMALLSHRLHAVHLICTRSWVRHIGVGVSMVTAQGFRTFNHPGYCLVPELEGLP